ncbi:hypothetical protein VTJ49DRAFT_6619 [Mycothermus thermophilus]|uniref:Uncharacterized protein n=1 Tax=Humicola insolens TaxID=85995 RepID=A0ABR3VJW7_HUMIN
MTSTQEDPELGQAEKPPTQPTELPVDRTATNPSIADGTLQPSQTQEHTPSAVTGPVDFASLPGLPRLRYNILESKLKLFTIVFLLVAEASLLPIGLYYGLILGTTLRPGLVFAVITSFFGIVSGIEFGLRCLKLIRHGEKYRPRGATKWSFDFTHWTLSVAYTVMSAILIIFSIPHDPLVRPLAMPVALFLVQAGLHLTWAGWMNAARWPAPFKISSVAKGEVVPPFVLTCVEDVVGVDGDGGREYRDALMARYAASPRFRKMIIQQNWFWAVGSLAVGAGTLVVVWTVPERVAYGVGWGAPLVFVIIWTTICVVWVFHSLRREKEAWRAEHSPEKQGASSTTTQETAQAASSIAHA